ncbi:hypothetical protein C8F01DRAFT_622875 [Mycena amicta]|nr:hypothetical protein C8F01DRAFT_622875 [Mycena amicta]
MRPRHPLIHFAAPALPLMGFLCNCHFRRNRWPGSIIFLVLQTHRRRPMLRIMELQIWTGDTISERRQMSKVVRRGRYIYIHVNMNHVRPSSSSICAHVHKMIGDRYRCPVPRDRTTRTRHSNPLQRIPPQNSNLMTISSMDASPSCYPTVREWKLGGSLG